MARDFGLTTALAAITCILVGAVSSEAVSLIGTSTTPDAFHSGSRFYSHCANGHYWVSYHDGTRPVLASSPDGVTWTPRGAIFSSFDPTADGRWAVRYSGDNIIALGFNATDNDRYYRNGTLNADGSITWAAADASVGLLTATWPQLNAVIANGKPALWRGGAGNTAEGALLRGDQLNTPAWVAAVAPPEMTPTTGGGFSAGAISPLGGADPDDLIILRATTVTPYVAGSHRLVAIKYDYSANTYDGSWYDVSLLGPVGGPFGLTEDPTTEVKDIGDGGVHQRFAAVRDTAGNLHAVYVNRNDDVVHYKKGAGFNDSWSRVSADVTQTTLAIDSVALTAGRNGQLYLFSLRTTSFTPFHYRRFNGTTWESENRGATNVGTVRGFGAMESTNGCSLGIAWAEGSGPYNIMFAVINDCPTLQTSEGAGTLTITAPDNFEMRFNAATGGGMDTFFDLAEDPTRAFDLAAGADSHETLFIDEVASGGTNYRTDQNTNGARAQLLEATPTRVRIRQEAFFQQKNDPAILTGIKGFGDYSIYGSGKMALGWSRKATSDVIYTGQELQHVVHYQSVSPLSTWAPFVDSGPLAPTGPGTSQFTLMVSATGAVRTDFLNILYADWAAADEVRWAPDAVNEYGSAEWRELTGGTIPAGSSETWNFLTYFKPTIFSDNVSASVLTRRDDYRAPASLSIMVGSPWNDPDEKTAGDDFNESEGAYLLTFDATQPSVGLRFDITGSEAAPRYRPFLKVRHWRSMSGPPLVTLEGGALTKDLDYKADVKPIARAHFAQDLSWYSTLQDPGAVTTPNVGTGGAVNLADFPFGAGRFGVGARFDADGESLSLPTAGNFSAAEGAIELWYRPAYDYGSDFGDTTDDFGLFGYYIDANNYFQAFHQPGSTAVDGIKFLVRSGGAFHVAQAGGPPGQAVLWRANEWVHLRFVWDDSPQKIELHVNGVLVASGATYVPPVGPAPDLYIGDRHFSADYSAYFQNNAMGIIDEFRIYSSADAPRPLAYGGLTANASEYLGSTSANFPLSFGAVDGVQRGEYFYLGSDSKFRGLNVVMATPGAGTVDLEWEYWNGTTWVSLEGGGFTDQTNHFTKNGTIYWTGDPFGWSVYSVNGGPDLYYVRASLASGSYSSTPVEGLIKTDILLFQYCGDITGPAQTLELGVPLPTAVELSSFTATGADSAVDLSWTTASELSNLGFHLYRADSAAGPYTRITPSLIPGLGSSPTGQIYSYQDSGLVNGRTYYYELEDIETTGRTERHGPVSATPLAGTGGDPGGPGGLGGSGDGDDDAGSTARITYGRPEARAFRVLKRGSSFALLELLTPGFYAVPEGDGTVRLEIPGFESRSVPRAPAVPVLRTFVEALAGRRVRLSSVTASEEVRYDGLRVATAGVPQLVVTKDGTVKPGWQKKRASVRRGFFPRSWAQLLGVTFQGETKKAWVELSPLRYDSKTATAVLARRMLVRLDFEGVERAEKGLGGSRGRRPRIQPVASTSGLVAELVTKEAGLYRVRFEDVLMGRRGVPSSSLRLSYQGRGVAYHLEPARALFGPGSTLYFVSEGAATNPWGDAVYTLETGKAAVRMATVNASPGGPATLQYLDRKEWEENRYYQAGLLDAPDPWLWDLMVSPVTKSYPFTLSQLSPTSTMAHLTVWLQGASDFEAAPDHHLRVLVNGTPVGEATWDAKTESVIEAEVGPGILREGANTLSLENVGDTSAAYSMVFLNRFSLRYPRLLVAENGQIKGSFSESGTAEVRGLAAPAFVVDTQGQPKWLSGLLPTGAGASFRAEAGRRYLAASSHALRTPIVRKPVASRLRSSLNRADWVLIAPREFLAVAQPLVDLRRSQGLEVAVASLEEISQEFGYGESRPAAVKGFLEHAYQSWQRPSLRYVVLLGDATYDPKDYLRTGVKDRIPPFLVKTSYLWTASDPAYAAVNGEDLLPDVAVGRLAAGTVEEARILVEKIVAFETAGRNLDGKAVLIADNADRGGSFEADVNELASTVLRGREVDKVFLRDLGSATRATIVAAFDSGPGLVSYVGHGGTAVWASENIFNNSDIPSLSAQSQQPFLMTMNCLNGFYHFPPMNSLAEAFVKAEGKGAVAAFSPSGLSVNDAAYVYHEAVLEQIESGRHARLGDAILAAQSAYADSGAMPELLGIYHLLGDPALLIR